MHANGNRGRLAVGDDRPRQLLVAEVLGHGDREDAPLPARQEVRRLAVIGTAGFDAVVGADRNVERLFQVAIEVADSSVKLPSGVLEPAFEAAVTLRPCSRLGPSGSSGAAATARPPDRQRQAKRSPTRERRRPSTRKARPTAVYCCRCVVVPGVGALRFSTSALKSSSLM